LANRQPPRNRDILETYTVIDVGFKKTSTFFKQKIGQKENAAIAPIGFFVNWVID